MPWIECKQLAETITETNEQKIANQVHTHTQTESLNELKI